MTMDDLAAAKVARRKALFETPVLIADIPDGTALAAELKKVIIARRAADAGVSRSNTGGWHSDIEMLKWGGEPARVLARQMVFMCNRFTTDVGQKDPDRPRFEWSAEMWANINPPGCGNEAHTHPGALWSSVFYVDDGLDEGDKPADAGHLILQDPRHPTVLMYQPDLRSMDEEGVVYNSRQRIQPTIGQLIAFPSWLEHWVTPHSGSRDRISIAVNMVALPARKA